MSSPTAAPTCITCADVLSGSPRSRRRPPCSGGSRPDITRRPTGRSLTCSTCAVTAPPRERSLFAAGSTRPVAVRCEHRAAARPHHSGEPERAGNRNPPEDDDLGAATRQSSIAAGSRSRRSSAPTGAGGKEYRPRQLRWACPSGDNRATSSSRTGTLLPRRSSMMASR